MERGSWSRVRRAAVIAAIAVGCCSALPHVAAAQDPGPEPGAGAAAPQRSPLQPQLPPAFFEPLRVPLVNVEVVVSDRSGAPIEGLGPGDFEVLQDGVPMAVTHFSGPGAPRLVTTAEVAAPYGTAPPVERTFLVLYVDDTAVEPQLRSAVLAQLRELASRPQPSGLSTMLARFDGRLHIESDFAAPADELVAAIDRLRAQPALDPTRDGEALLQRMQSMAQRPRTVNTTPPASIDGETNLPVRPATDPADVEPEAYAFLPEIHQVARNRHLRGRVSLAGLQSYLELLGTIPGRKVVLWVGGLELRAGEGLFRTWQDLFQGAARRHGGDPMMESMQYDLSRELRALLEAANGERISFITVSSPSGGGRDGSAIDARVLESPGRPGRQDHRDVRSQEEALAMMALVTGGRSLATARLGEQLALVADDLDNAYSLAYRPPTAGDGAFHEISVKVRRPDASVRHRAGYRDPGEGAPAEGRTLAAALLGTGVNQLGVGASCEAQEAREDGSFLVPVRLTVPIENLVLLPKGDRHTARISVLTVVRDAAGGVSEVYRREYPIEIGNEELIAAVEQPAAFVLGMVLRPGPYRIAICVRDDRSLVESTVLVDVVVGEGAGSPSG